MRFRFRPSWALVALGLVFAACGVAEPDRFDQRTPGANTGEPVVPLPTLTPAPEATKPEATPTPTPQSKRVTKAERRIIKAWADELRHGRVNAASRYFSVPSLVSNDTAGWAFLDTPKDVKEFNRTLPCGAKLISTQRGAEHFVVGIFKLTERRGAPAGGCGTGTGNKAAVAFLIQKHHITHWVRVDPNAPGQPSPGTDPAAPSATATPSATPTATPTETATPVPTQAGVPTEA
jgi:hypothetical protein